MDRIPAFLETEKRIAGDTAPALEESGSDGDMRSDEVRMPWSSKRRGKRLKMESDGGRRHNTGGRSSGVCADSLHLDDGDEFGNFWGLIGDFGKFSVG